jgi:hypothetical protein
MSTVYEAFLGIGRRFSDEMEVKDFLLQKTDLSTERIEKLLEGDCHLGMCVVCLDCNGDDWFVGFEIGCDTYVALSYHVVDAHERWKDMFPTSAPRVVHAVKIW